MNSSNSKILIPASQITASTFLSMLFQPDDWISLRLVQTWEEDDKKKTKVVGEYCYQLRYLVARDALQLEIIADHAERDKANLFFGVNPRPCRSGNPWRANEGSVDCAGHIGVIRNYYCDLDQTPPDEAAKITPTPSIVLASGNASHVYWRLAQPVTVPHTTSPVFKRKGPRGTITDHADGPGVPKPSPEAEHVSTVLAGLSESLNGDHCTDLARLLRLPGTLNYKGFRNGRQPKPVYVHAVNDVTYSFSDFEKYAMSVPSTTKKANTRPVETALIDKDRVANVFSKDLAKLEDAIRACQEAVVGSRSEYDYALVCRAVQLGLDPDAVWNEVSPISKFAERTRESYFDKMWEKAAARQQADDLKFAELDAAIEVSITKVNPTSPAPAAPLTITEADRGDPRFAYLWRGQHGKRLADAQRAARIRSLKEVYDLTPAAVHAYFDWASPATDAPPIFHLGGYIAIASTLLNRRVWLDIGGHKVRPQTWVANLAESSVHRKSTAANFVKFWMHKDAVYSRTLPTSPESAYYRLARDPC
ncbi:MAG: hypothetical protein FJ271_27575 [Planctomycetes bacterium]|nr:hypothetical protein [Planctomycetota bacterium]